MRQRKKSTVSLLMTILLTMQSTISFPSYADDSDDRIAECKTDDYGFKRCHTRLENGEAAPFRGVLMDNAAVAYIQSEKTKQAKICEEDKEFADKMCKIDTDSERQKIEALTTSKEKELKILQDALNHERSLLEKSIDKQDPVGFFESPELWISVGFIAGVVFGAGVAYAGAWAWGTVNPPNYTN